MRSEMDLKSNLIIAGICIVILFFLVSCHNTATESDWNNGICPKCGVKYELRGVSGRMVKEKYYSCPECGKEVERY